MSIVKQLLAGTTPSELIEGELFSRSAFLIEEIKKPIMEMRDSPDQSAYPLTRREVEKMLTKYERREDDSTGLSNPEARTIDGAKKARWYSPEESSDFVDEFVDGATGEKKNIDDRPAKLMPYDYKFTVHKPGDINQTSGKEIGDADTDNDKQDWSGEFNKYFTESENVQDAGQDDIKNLFHDAVKNTYPIDLHLDDGSFVSIEPHQAQHIINSNKVDMVTKHMGSPSHFKMLLKDVYSSIDGEQHAG